MKQLIFCCAGLFLLFSACKSDGSGNAQKEKGPNASVIDNPISADQPLDSTKLARIKFDSDDFDFGDVTEGTLVKHSFKFTNTGAVPLLITNCRSSCGCTVPNWPEDPIPPGGTGEINATFNTEGRPGPQRKLIYIDANTFPGDVKILLKGIVDKKQ